MRSSPSPDQSLTRDYYDILGLGPQATKAEIKRAYRKLIFRYHPDRNPGDAEAKARFLEVMEAYGVLTNPIRRWHYDHRAEHFSSGPAARSGNEDRPWWRRPSLAGLGLGLVVLMVLGSYFALRAGGSDRDGAYEAVVARADSLFEAADYRGALGLYFEARRLRPTTHVLVRLNESMDRVVAGAQGRPTATPARGDSLVRQADLLRRWPEASEAERAQAAEHYVEASEVYLVALRESPGDSALIGKVERVAERMQQVLASETAPEPAAEEQASSEPATTDAGTAEVQRQLLFIVHSQQGDVLMLEGRLVEARAKYEEALTYQPGDPYLLSRLERIGEALDAAAAAPEAASASSTLVRLSPAALDVGPILARLLPGDRETEWQYRHFRARGDAMMAKRDYQAATNNYRSALASKPDDDYAAQRLAEAQARLKE